MKVNKAQLADVLCVSEKTLSEWQKEDPPLPMTQAAKRGQPNEYDTGVVIEWLVLRRMRSASIETPKDRLLRLQAEEVTLRLAEKRGDLVNTSQLEPELERTFMAFRSRLLDAAAAIESECLNLIDADQLREVAAVVDGQIRQALSELGQWDPEAPTSTTGSEG